MHNYYDIVWGYPRGSQMGTKINFLNGLTYGVIFFFYISRCRYLPDNDFDMVWGHFPPPGTPQMDSPIIDFFNSLT